MFTCKQVSKTLAEHNYQDLPLLKRIGLRIHVALCLVCGRFNKQVMVMQDTCCAYKKNEDFILEKLPEMPEIDKEKLRASISKQLQDSV